MDRLMAVIDEPPTAIAAGRCLTARSLARKPADVWTTSHPSRCGWCDYPPAALARLIEGFNGWAGYKPATNTYARYDAQAWSEMARQNPAEAERQIVAAQALEAMAPADEPPAHEPEPPAPPVDEELAAWT